MPKDYKRTPTRKYRFFLNDPLGNGMMYFRTVEDRDAEAKETIAACLDGNEWADETTEICTGEVTHVVEAVNDNPEVNGYDYRLVKVGR